MDFGALCVIAEICEAKNGVRAGRPPSRLEGERISVSLDLDQVQFAENYPIFAFLRNRNCSKFVARLRVYKSQRIRRKDRRLSGSVGQMDKCCRSRRNIKLVSTPLLV